jgi:S-adenosylmethionine decarboxylase
MTAALFSSKSRQESVSIINMPLGTEWVVDANGCDATSLANPDRLKEVFARVIDDLQLHVVGDVVWHQFPAPFGITGLALLTESHLACHTYPEHQAATFNLYCCRERTSWPWEIMLKEILGATEVNVRVFDRVLKASAIGREELTQCAG